MKFEQSLSKWVEKATATVGHDVENLGSTVREVHASRYIEDIILNRKDDVAELIQHNPIPAALAAGFGHWRCCSP